MSINESNLTENKKTEKSEYYKLKKDNLLDIKQNLFQQLTTQSSRKLKNKENDESTYKNKKYQNFTNLKNYEDSNSNRESKLNSNDKYPYINSNIWEKDKKKEKNNYIIENKNKTEKKSNKKILIKNDNDIMTYFSKIQGKDNNQLNYSKEEINKVDEDKFNNNNDLIYLLTTQKSENESETEGYDRVTSHIGLPFCHYHKYNILLPKQYTCNFKNCSCCGFLSKKNSEIGESEANRYKNKKDYIYPINKTDKKNCKYRSVLDKFRNKNKKTISDDSFNSNKLGNLNLKFLKPDNTNLKITKKNFLNVNGIAENESDENDINQNDSYENNNNYDNDNLRYKNYNEDYNNKNNNESITHSDNDENNTNNKNYNDENLTNYYDENNTNNKIYTDENDISKNYNEIYGNNKNNIKENNNNENESKNSDNESSLLDLPYDCNDDINLKKYKNLVNKTEKKSKIHFSVMYYKRLNKSYSQIYSKDIKQENNTNNSYNNIKGVNKNKNIEFLRES